MSALFQGWGGGRGWELSVGTEAIYTASCMFKQDNLELCLCPM